MTKKIQELTTQLELLKAANPQRFFTANDYVEQGKALYIEGRYEEAIASYEQVSQINPLLSKRSKTLIFRGLK